MCLSGPRPLEYRTKAGFYPLDSNPTLENVKTSKVLFRVSFRRSPSQPVHPGRSKSVRDYAQVHDSAKVDGVKINRSDRKLTKPSIILSGKSK